MTEDIATVANAIAVGGFFALLSLPLYVLLGMPGLLASRLAKRWFVNNYWCRAAVVIVFGAFFFSPTLITGFHIALIVPAGYPLVGAEQFRLRDALSVAVGAVVLCALSWRYWSREVADAQVGSWLEGLWRGA